MTSGDSQKGGSRARAAAADWALYFVTDTAMAGGPSGVPAQVTEAIEGGAHVIQVRDKDATDEQYLELARAVRDAAYAAGDEVGREILVFANDHVEAAKELGLDIHVGQSDMPAAKVREIVGPDCVIGVSVSTEEQLAQVVRDGVADAVGLGPVWDTATKTDTDSALGLTGTARLAAQAKEAGLVSAAIGGITIRNAASVAATGVDGICVVSAIAAAEDPALAATFLRREFVMNQPD